ncbi:hypothetical protein Z945_3408 [Sulfitobacter noctilucae]|nr:hypothetical protein Z945_3408 [Sulfitobacter noctilucae]
MGAGPTICTTAQHGSGALCAGFTLLGAGMCWYTTIAQGTSATTA